MPTIVRFANGTAVLYPERMFVPPGEVWRWSQDLADEIGEAVRESAPVRTGVLRNSVDADSAVTSRLRVSISVKVRARHAKYVIFGTDDGVVEARRVIRAGHTSPVNTASRYAPGSAWPRKIVRRGQLIHGQKANDFVETGLSIVAGAHPEAMGGLAIRVL